MPVTSLAREFSVTELYVIETGSNPVPNRTLRTLLRAKPPPPRPCMTLLPNKRPPFHCNGTPGPSTKRPPPRPIVLSPLETSSQPPSDSGKK